MPRHVAQLVAPLFIDYSASRRLIGDYFAPAARPGASARRAARRRLLRLRRASGCLGTSRGSSSTTSPTSRVRVPRYVVRLVVDYFTSAARPGASAHCAARHAARRAAHRRLLRARRRLLQLRRASGCLGTLRGSSRGSSRRPSSTTPGSSSTTSPPPSVRVPHHVARLITRLIAPPIVDYSGLVVDYFASAAHPGASARRAARHAALRAARRRLLRLAQARCRLLRLRRASGCLGTSRGTSRSSSRCSSLTTPPRAGSSSTTSPSPRVRVPRHVARLVLDYFTFAACPSASARRAARRRLLRVAQARRRLLHRASGCLGTSRGSSRG
jgi:hypothetical protein